MTLNETIYSMKLKDQSSQESKPKYNHDPKGSELPSDALSLAQESNELLQKYLNSDETVVGFGYGGSESMTLFLQKPGSEKFVRKVLSEQLITPKWSREGSNVMLPPCAKAKSQTQYLMNLPDTVKPLFPKVLNIIEREQKATEDDGSTVYEYIYDMTFVPGIEVSQFVRKYNPPKKIVAALYRIIFQLLNEKIHSQRRRQVSCPTLEQSYFTKIEKRLALAQDTAPKTFSDKLLKAEEIMINGKRMSNLPRLLRKFRSNLAYLDILEPKFHSLVVGDTNTENIKIGNIEPLLRDYVNFSITNPPFSAEDLEIRFLDPRAIGFHQNGIDTGADDPMYDNKPWHNSLGNYDKIHGEHFDLAYQLHRNIPHIFLVFHEDNPYEYSYRGIEEYFSEVMNASWNLDNPDSDINRHDPNWLIRFVFLMGTHFMAMPPFHFSKGKDGVLIDDAHNQSRPLAIYAEGIKWLNLTLDLLEERIDKFHGIPVNNFGIHRNLVNT
ncbi:MULTISPECIES: hypothetical protein [unclassified Anabaena]|uniref:hypothetical protein n=1 Tax=unclassified Anabaena TaxID=2619674 RepID=UPI0039C60DDD